MSDKNKTPQFKLIRQVALPQLKLDEGKDYYLTVIDKPIQKASPKEGEGPMTILRVKNELTGSDCELIAGHVLVGSLADAYPKGDFVNKTFHVVKEPQRKGQSGRAYSPYRIVEVTKE